MGRKTAIFLLIVTYLMLVWYAVAIFQDYKTGQLSYKLFLTPISLMLTAYIFHSQLHRPTKQD